MILNPNILISVAAHCYHITKNRNLEVPGLLTILEECLLRILIIISDIYDI